MDPAGDIREFLTSRRAKITPDEAGLLAFGTNRRVKGLRREEVAMLAGISAEYYTRFERGNASGASDEVIEGVARALQLDDAERTHLFDLVSTANASFRTTRRRPTQERVRPVIQRILDSISAPAYVRNGRLDLLAANPLGRALYAPVFESPSGLPNMARFIFLDESATDFFPDWEKIASDAVAILRAEVGRDPYDKTLSNLVGISRSTTRRWSSPATPANASSSTAPSHGAQLNRRSICSRAGPRVRPMNERLSQPPSHESEGNCNGSAAEEANYRGPRRVVHR